MFTQSKNINVNYAAEIVKIESLEPHPNADRLSLITIHGNQIICGKESFKEGDFAIYCPSASVLSADFLKSNNLYRHTELNENKDSKGGFFEDDGRVRAIRLRSLISEGCLFPVSTLKCDSIKLSPRDIGKLFDTFNGNIFIKKYIPQRIVVKNEENNKKNKRILKKFDILIENQFRFHYDTGKLENAIHIFNPDDIVHISKKYHGTSAILAYVLTNKKLTWYEKTLKKIGVNIEDKKYDFLVSSRTVIKNRYLYKETQRSYYDANVWEDSVKVFKEHIEKGMTIYYEIVGYLPNSGTYIQKYHDYGCTEGKYRCIIYRITITNYDGQVYEFTPVQVSEWCSHRGLESVKTLYYGKLRDLYPHLNIDNHWHENLILQMKQDRETFGMETMDKECKSKKAPIEGIVIKKSDTSKTHAYKLKTQMHLLHETEILDDSNVVLIEE